MSKVSTRPHQSATPVTETATGVTAEPASKALVGLTNTPANLSRVFSLLEDVLRKASFVDEPDCLTGDSLRLLSIGADLASQAAKKVPTAEHSQNLGHDIAALVKASRRVPGDPVGDDRAFHTAETGPLLEWLTGDPEALSDSPWPAVALSSAEKPSAGGTNGPLCGYTPAQACRAFEEIASRASTMAHMARQDHGSYADQALEIATTGFDVIGALADQMSGQGIVGTLADWVVGHSFYQAGKAVEA